jgi:hypothetical protein
MASVIKTIAILAGTYIVIDQYQDYKERRAAKKAKQG